MSASPPAAKPPKATATTNPGASPPPEPPAEEFWERYSPHFEFPISTVSTVVIHVVAVLIVFFIVARIVKQDDKTPVPITQVNVTGGTLDGSGGEPGSGGGQPDVEASEDTPRDPRPEIPEETLKREMISAKSWLPDLKDNPEALATIVKSPNYKKLNEVSDEVKKRIAQGFSEKSGTGDGTGMGNSGEAGKGAGGAGNPKSSARRSMRWTILFRTSSGADYLEQLNAFKAKVVIPEPPDWKKKNRLFEDLTSPNAGKSLGEEDLPKMYFVDNNKVSAAKVAHTLGLNFAPPNFIAFFPKDMEEKMAEMERDHRGRKEADIQETIFRVYKVNGRYEIEITDQIPVPGRP